MPARRDLRLITAAVGLSALGDFVAVVALGIHVEQTTGSAFAVSAVFAAVMCPVVLLAPLAGLLVDRVENARLLALVSLASAGAAAGLAFAGGLAATLALATLLGSLAAVAGPAEFALVPAIAGEAEIAKANARVETARYLGFTAGPLLGGVLTAGGGTTLALLVDAASFLAIGVGALALQARRHPSGVGAHKDRARDGIAALLSDGELRAVVLAVVGALLFMSMSIPADVFFAQDVLDAGAFGYGLLLTVWTLGMVAGSLGLAARVPATAVASAALLATAIQGSGKVLAAAGAILALALAGYLIGGIAHGVRNVLARTLIHERVPERLRGRAFAAYSALRNGAEFTALAAGGAVVAAMGPRTALVVAGLGTVVCALAGLAALAPRFGLSPASALRADRG